MHRRRLLAAVACVSLVLAGVAHPVAPAAGQHPAGGPADTGPDVSAGSAVGETGTNGATGPNGTGAVDTTGQEDLPVDEDLVWIRVRAMMETEAGQPDLMVGTPGPLADETLEPEPSAFREALNLTERGEREAGPRGAATPFGVFVDPADGRPAVVEQVVVHEYAHSVQYSESMFDHWLRAPVRTTDQRLVQTALIEGGATYVADEYTERHLEGVPPQSAQMKRSYERAAPGDRLFVAPYYFGAEYVGERIDSPAELERVYLDPPYNTAELLHGEAAGEELPLSVRVDDAGSDWRATDEDTKGELFTRVALRATLADETAAPAAAGWGNDSAVGIDGDGDGDPDAFVWAFRWQTGEDAAEFADAFRASLDRRTDDWADRTDVDRVDDRTVVVTMGSDAFREATRIRASGGEVRVRVDADERRTVCRSSILENCILFAENGTDT